MNSLQNLISDSRVFLYGGIQTLPLTIGGTLLILGLFTANYAILFFLLGFLMVVPLISKLLNVTLESLLLNFPNVLNQFRVKTSDICKVVVPFTTLQNPVRGQEEYVIFSSWLAMILFFVGYLFTNAFELFNRDASQILLNVNTSNQSDVETKTTTRKSQAMIAMASILFFGLIIIGYRLYSGCENGLGVLITALLFSYLGSVWYRLLASVGEDRLSDLFGIANRLLPPSAIENKPIACIPIRT